MTSGVYVTGLGVISSIGVGVEANWTSLSQGRSGIVPQSTLGLAPDFPVGEVALSNDQLKSLAGTDQKIVARTALLGLVAAQEAWKGHKHHAQIRTGLIGATSVGGMDQSEQFYRQWLQGGNANAQLLKAHDSGLASQFIARQLGINGYVNTISTACSSGANAIILGARLIQAGRLDRVLVGGMDALCRFTMEGFNSLMIYDKEWCRPFDETRVGLNLGEGAAFLVLESAQSLALTQSDVKGIFKGGANAADAYHQTASSPEGKGATLAIEEALRIACVDPSSVDYVNAHGTGTKNNDLSESVALRTIFAESVPSFSSTKAYTGHTLAAAGAIEAVYSLLAIERKVLLPNLNYTTPIQETGLVPVQQWTDANVSTVLSNSFGFGGNNSALIFTQS